MAEAFAWCGCGFETTKVTFGPGGKQEARERVETNLREHLENDCPIIEAGGETTTGCTFDYGRVTA